MYECLLARPVSGSMTHRSRAEATADASARFNCGGPGDGVHWLAARDDTVLYSPRV